MAVDVLSQPDLYERQKVAYERRVAKQGRITVPFAELLAMFTDAELGFVDIARRIRISRRATRFLYRDCFQSFVGKSGMELKRMRVKVRQEERSREPAEGRLLGPVTDAAEEAGLVVRRISRRGRLWDGVRTALCIEGQRCEVKRITSLKTVQGNRKRRYALAVFSRQTAVRYDAHIVHVDVPEYPSRMSIIPTYILNRIPDISGRRYAWVPMNEASIRRRSRVDWTKYENAWHLLEGE